MGHVDNMLAYRVPEAAKRIGVSRSKLWALIAEGKIQTRKLDNATLVLHHDLEAFLASLPMKAAQSDIKR